MLELPEVLTISAQLRENLVGERVYKVYPPSRPHKFCWFNGAPEEYGKSLQGRRVTGAEGFGIFAELAFEDGFRLCFNDGVNVRLVPEGKAPENYQLLVSLEGGQALLFTVAMYGGIILHRDDYGNEYYASSRRAVSPFSEGFADYYRRMLDECKPALSAKAFLATEQRFPGIGNGVLQDILFEARIHPKRKLGSLDEAERDRLGECAVSVLKDMTAQGGRDTEKDLFGNPGGYRTKMSKNSMACGCPACGGPITKEAYLGGSVYYCPACQRRG